MTRPAVGVAPDATRADVAQPLLVALRAQPGRRRAFPTAPHSASLCGVASATSAAACTLRRTVHSWSSPPAATQYGTLADSTTLLLQSPRRTSPNLNATPIAAVTHQPATTATNATIIPNTNTTTTAAAAAISSLFSFNMPGIRSLMGRRRNDPPSGPLMRRDSNSLARLSEPLTATITTTPSSTGSTSSLTTLTNGLRKCETVLALTGLGAMLRPNVGGNGNHTTRGNNFSNGGISAGINSLTPPAPVQPVNRLRVTPATSTSRLCSRCSSLLSLAASGSRYSLNQSGFVPVEELIVCKLCLSEVDKKDTVSIEHCDCSFCKECMKAYVEFEIAEGAYDISCPDAQCPSQGVLHISEVERLVEPSFVEKHRKYRLNREVDLDANRTWCPRAGCETVCRLCPSERCAPQSVHCPTCTSDFCSNCKLAWHAGLSCDEYTKQLAKEGKAEESGIPFDSDLIKCCPMCNVPIEKDEGCAQMMCKRCKHVFCWYCLTSLDDDFLLRHYDKGPCKNKLGHSRASVIWHRTQVIGIFAGFGILLLVASPLLLLAAPCIVCCKCRVCNAGPKLENDDEGNDGHDDLEQTS